MSALIRIFSAVVFTGLCFSSCSHLKQSLKRSVVVALPDTSFIPGISSTALTAKYTCSISPQQILNAFLKGFKREAATAANIRLHFNNKKADFILTLKQLQLTESSGNHRVLDPASKCHDQDVVLNTVEVACEFDIVWTKEPGKKLTSCANKNKLQEPEGDNSLAAGHMADANKDTSACRSGILKNDIALSLAEGAGRNIWMPISRRISNMLK